MAEQNVSDLFMRFVDSNNTPLKGESRTDIDVGGSAMTRDFKRGEMLEIESFTLKTGLSGEDEDELAAKLKKQSDTHTKNFTDMTDQLRKKGIDLSGIKLPSAQGFKKFREGVDTPYPVDMKPVELTRVVDISSPVLLQNMIERRVFKRATLIKRKAAGGPSAGEVFLRFDFTSVLIKSIDWDNEEPVKETIEFVCRALTINYLPQLPDGSLGAPRQTSWSAPRPELPPIILR